MNTSFKTFLVFGGTIATFLFGTWHISITILLVMMLLENLITIVKGFYTGELKLKRGRSFKGFKGWLKSVWVLNKSVWVLIFKRTGLSIGIFVLIAVANLLDVLLGNIAPVFRTMVIYYFIGIEGKSIINSLGAMGIAVPEAIKEKLSQLKDLKDNKNEKSQGKDDDKK